MKLENQLQKYALYAGAAVAVILIIKISTSSAKDVAKSIAGGIVGGTIDAVQGAIVGSYEALPDAIKPSSDGNIINQGVNKAVQVLTGDDKQTLGGWIYDITH